MAVDEGWRSLAECIDTHPSLFFPEVGGSTREPKEVCRGCLVRRECLEYALENHITVGIWGGTGERERRRILRQRALAHQLRAS